MAAYIAEPKGKGVKESLNPDTYVSQMALVLNLPLDREYRTGVVENFASIAAIAQLVLEFPLPDQVEVAPTFQP